MCTLTVCQTSEGLIITMNRDERRDRIEGSKLAITNHEPQVAYPVDGQSGGSWLGVNSAGVVMALLNRYQDTIVASHLSRGLIIPQALAAGQLNKVLSFCQKLIVRDYQPFDLLVFTTAKWIQYSWSGQHFHIATLPSSTHYIHSSSSVATDAVISSRKTFFTQWFKSHHKQPITAAMLRQHVHLQRDQNDPCSSIFMAREHTHSKSICQVLLTDHSIQLDYYNPPESLSITDTVTLTAAGSLHATA